VVAAAVAVTAQNVHDRALDETPHTLGLCPGTETDLRE
jgi:hypothetical protein